MGSGAEGEKARKEKEQQHESEIQIMQMSLKKAEKEIGYKDEEVRHYKQMASQVAEKYEKCDRTIQHLKNTIQEKDQANDRLDLRIGEYEVRIGKLNTDNKALQS